MSAHVAGAYAEDRRNAAESGRVAQRVSPSVPVPVNRARRRRGGGDSAMPRGARQGVEGEALPQPPRSCQPVNRLCPALDTPAESRVTLREPSSALFV